jgi:hypothetical protein
MDRSRTEPRPLGSGFNTGILVAQAFLPVFFFSSSQFGFVGKENSMATLKQFEANRRNAQKSTGPKTPEGKAVISMNALRHGLRARTVVLPGENREEFTQLCDDLEVEWHPQSRTEQFYVEQMAVSQWKLTRMEVSEVNLFQDTDSAKNQLPLLDRLWQAECRLERSYARAQRELERLQHARSQPAPSAVGQAVPPVQQSQSAPASPDVEPTNTHPSTSDTLTPEINGCTVNPVRDPAIRFEFPRPGWTE